MSINPLVAGHLSGPPNAWSGVWIAEDIQLIHQGVYDGSWIDTTLGSVGAGLDALAMLTDKTARCCVRHRMAHRTRQTR